MLDNLNLEQWLVERSKEVKRTEGELAFEHLNGRRSVLLLQKKQAAAISFNGFPSLAEFYAKYCGGFVGNGFLVIGTPFDHPLKTSCGFTVPTLQQIRAVSEREGISFIGDEIPFMTTAYMFVYSFSKAGRLRCHDRDFKVVTDDQTAAQILENWWEIQLSES